MARIIAPIVLAVILFIFYWGYLRFVLKIKTKILQNDIGKQVTILAHFAGIVTGLLILLNEITSVLGYQLFVLEADEAKSAIIIGSFVIARLSYQEFIKFHKKLLN